jgi:hypothetical protein
MKSVHMVLAIAACGLVLSTSVHAVDYKVIANASVKAADISADDLKGVFLVTKTSVDGSEVTPVLAKAGPAHEAMLKSLGKTEAALSTYYRSLVFTGKAAMPKTLASDADVAEYVGKTAGAIGYIGTASNAGAAKTLSVK